MPDDATSVRAGPHGAFTPRALLLGVLGVAAQSWVTPWCDLVLRGTWVGLTAFPIDALAGLLLLVGGNALLPTRHRLGPAELRLVYAMLLAAAGVASFGLTGLLVPYAAGPRYFARPENQFYEGVIRYLPRWLLCPPEVSRALYEGLPPGHTIALGVWLRLAFGWGWLVGGVYLCLGALARLVAPSWIVSERLVFPLMALPLTLSDDPVPYRWPELLRDPVVWGFARVPCLIHALGGLHARYPGVPALNLDRFDLGALWPGHWGEAVAPLWLRFSFTALGLSFLLPSNLSFSLWFFYLFFLVQQLLGAHLGWAMPFVQALPVRRFVALQMIGGVIVSGCGLVGRLRPWRESSLATSIGLAGFGLLLAWGSLTGVGGGWVGGLLALFLLYQLVATRLVAEAGMLYVQHPHRPLNLVLSVLGTAGPTPRRLPLLTLLDHLFMLDNRSPLQPALLGGLKLAEASRLPGRGFLAAMALAVALAVPLSLASYLRLMLTSGGTSLNPWFTSYYVNNLWCTWTTHLTLAGEPATRGDLLWLAAGMLSFGGLSGLHRLWWQWPLHPLGYLMGASWPMINFWFPIFCGWLLKTVVLRLGGARAYRRLLPGFIALILAEYASAAAWVLLDALTGVHGHEIFSF